jgi:hypothetical protein
MWRKLLGLHGLEITLGRLKKRVEELEHLIGGSAKSLLCVKRDFLTPVVGGVYNLIEVGVKDSLVWEFTGWVDLSDLNKGDTIILKYIVNDGTYVTRTYENPQSEPKVYFPLVVADSIVVELKQETGHSRTFTFQFYWREH